MNLDVEDSNEKVLRLTAALHASNERVSDFIDLALHDLRAPVRAITSLTGFLHEELAPQLDETSKEFLELIERRALRLHTLIEDLADYAMAGEVVLASTRIDLDRLVSEAVSKVDARGCLILTEATEHQSVLVQAAPVIHCLVQLLDNACRHHDEPTRARVAVELKASDEWLEVVVEDNGPGIPSEFQERVFEPFRTLRSCADIEGSGIGLPTVVRAVEVHGGSVQLQSKDNEGTTVRIRWRLPSG